LTHYKKRQIRTCGGALSPSVPPDPTPLDCKDDNDQIALSRHSSKSHGIVSKPPLHEAYTVACVEQPSFHSLDTCEDKWYHQRDARITVQHMIHSM